jgi:hypothetical protein
MTSAHLLVATLFLCSGAAFAQQHESNPSNPSQPSDQEKPAWQLSFDAPKNLLAKNGSFPLLLPSDSSRIASDKRLIDDTVCYKMRSYVVARDSKNSDSVHPVGYSTCQPAGKYRLRTTEMSTPTLKR